MANEWEQKVAAHLLDSLCYVRTGLQAGHFGAPGDIPGWYRGLPQLRLVLLSIGFELEDRCEWRRLGVPKL